MLLLEKIKHKFKKENKPYRLKKINPIKKAKAMDLVLELCMNYYIQKEDKIDFYKVERKLYNVLGLHSWESEFLLDTMSDLGYIKEIYKNDNKIDKIYCEPKGIEVYISGGFELEAIRKSRERRLIKIGQWSSGIIGLYYLATFLIEYLMPLYELLKNLICTANIPQ